MRISYVARSFLDYRTPVMGELDNVAGGGVHFIFSDKWTPRRAVERMRGVLGTRAICLTGEKSLGVDVPAEANRSFCVPYQPGLLRAIEQTKPDVLVGDGFFQWTYAALLHRVLHGAPLVICYERWAHTERGAQWYRRLYRRMALKFTDAVCCNGRLSAEYVVSLGYPRERITTGHMAADVEGLAEKSREQGAGSGREERGAGSGEQSGNQKAETSGPWSVVRGPCGPSPAGLVFLYVGRLIKIKGLAELLSGWGEFQKAGSRERGAGSKAGRRPTLVIVGTGPEEENLKRQAEEARLQNVSFVGAVDYSRIAEYYASADVLVMPTLEDNWSLVVPEAMACGLPILCSKYNGCWPELVQEGRNGWVFDPLDTADTVRCLDACVRASHLPAPRSPLPAPCSVLESMGQESREVLKDHTPRKAAEAIYRACEIAVKQKLKAES